MVRTIEGESGNLYSLEGPFDFESIRDVGGIYVIVCPTPLQTQIVDIGESGQLKTRLDNHERRDCWYRNCNPDRLQVYVFYTPGMSEEHRMEIEADLRSHWNPPCGKW
jgi:hypothetical protein